jgi:hypothetical protein
LQLEVLEPRQVLSAAALVDSSWVATPRIQSLATQAAVVGLTPAQVRHAYGFDQVSFAGGTIPGDGRGTTIAIVDAYSHPNIFSDLQIFDQTFGLPDPPTLAQVNQNGGTQLPATDPGWAQEIALDVEWAHAIAPQANILLVEANSASLLDLLTAVNYARQQPGVVAVSMSWGGGESWIERLIDPLFTTPSGHSGVSFIASSGDNGAGSGFPAVSPNVLAVGGTTLNLAGGNYASETAWSGSGGGFSWFEPEPAYQYSVHSIGRRTIPDVAYDANPTSGVAVFDSVPIGGRNGWFQIGGTSAGAPQWAGLVAIADQGRALAGLGSLANVQSLVYSLPSSDFHDIVAGSNGYSTLTGYDLVTGRGSPRADLVIRDLVAASTSAASSHAAAGASASPSTPARHPVFIIVFAAQPAAGSGLPGNAAGQTNGSSLGIAAAAMTPPGSIVPAPGMRVDPYNPTGSFSINQTRFTNLEIDHGAAEKTRPADKPFAGNRVHQLPSAEATTLIFEQTDFAASIPADRAGRQVARGTAREAAPGIFAVVPADAVIERDEVHSTRPDHLLLPSISGEAEQSQRAVDCCFENACGLWCPESAAVFTSDGIRWRHLAEAAVVAGLVHASIRRGARREEQGRRPQAAWLPDRANHGGGQSTSSAR